MENLHSNLFKRREGERGKEQEQRSEQQVSEDRRGDRVWRIYTGIDMRDIPEDRRRDREQISYNGIS